MPPGVDANPDADEVPDRMRGTHGYGTFVVKGWNCWLAMIHLCLYLNFL